jgi:hypothetical protein
MFNKAEIARILKIQKIVKSGKRPSDDDIQFVLDCGRKESLQFKKEVINKATHDGFNTNGLITF